MSGFINSIKHWFYRTFKADEVNIVSTDLIIERDDPRDIFFGASSYPKRVIRPDGQWGEVYTPLAEVQRNAWFESMGCTGFAFNNTIEFIAFYKWAETWNKSDKYTNAIGGTTNRGNDPQRIIDQTRIFGSVDEKDDPIDWSIENEADFRKWPISNLIEKGKAWLKLYDVNYERVGNYPQYLMEALKYSTIYTNGFAWAYSNGLYKSWGSINHQFVIIGYKENEYWLVFDTYPPFIKKLAWDYSFGTSRIILLNKKNIGFNQELINSLMAKGLEYVLLVEHYETFDAGTYKLTANGLEKAQLKTLLDNGVLKLAQENKLQGRNAVDFSKLLM